MRLALKNGLSLPGVGQPLQRTRVGQGGLDSPCKEQGLDRGLDSPYTEEGLESPFHASPAKHNWTATCMDRRSCSRLPGQKMGVPGGGKGAGGTAAIAAAPVAELKFRLGWI